MSIYPISLVNLKNYLAVIIGGGHVAARKLASLWDTDFQIKIISPSLCEDILSLTTLKRDSPVQIISRPYQVGDLRNAFLVIAATNDSQVNEQVWIEAVQEKCLINITNNPAKSNFYNPSILQYGSLTVAFSSIHGCPALLSWLRKQCETIIDDDFIELFEATQLIRIRLIHHYPNNYDIPEDNRIKWENFNNHLISILEKEGVFAAKKAALEFLKKMP